MSKASDLARLLTSGNTSLHGEAGVTSSDSTGKTTNLQNGLTKVWLSYDADTSNNIDDSLNLASITDNGTGDATHTWTNPASADTYCFQVTATQDAAGGVGYGYGYAGSQACRTNRTASNHRVTVGWAGDANLGDLKVYCYSWDGDLA
tara:strand:- start:818 stop:1261 length:444 start_codon:yes stop_codon:yes gene_type:complete